MVISIAPGAFSEHIRRVHPLGSPFYTTKTLQMKHKKPQLILPKVNMIRETWADKLEALVLSFRSGSRLKKKRKWRPPQSIRCSSSH